MNRIRLFAAAAIGFITASSVWAQVAPGAAASYGNSVADSEAERTIQIGPETRYVNVMRRENVRFVVGSGAAQRSFSWRFDVLSMRSFDLREVAPANVLGGQPITVYLGRNPLTDHGISR